MTKTPQELIISALIAKLGGEVTISAKDIIDAEDFELTRWDDVSTNGIRYTAKRPPATFEGEIIEDAREIEKGR